MGLAFRRECVEFASLCKAIETVRNTLMGKDQAAEEMRQIMSECSGRTTGSQVQAQSTTSFSWQSSSCGNAIKGGFRRSPQRRSRTEMHRH